MQLCLSSDNSMATEYFFSVKGRVSRVISTVFFPNFHIMPNLIKSTNKMNKTILQSKIEQVFCGRSTGLQGGKWNAIRRIWFVTACQELKIAIEYFSYYFLLFSWYFFAFTTFVVLYFHSKIIKKVYSKLSTILIKKRCNSYDAVPLNRLTFTSFKCCPS